MLDAREIYPLSDFQRNAKQFIEQYMDAENTLIFCYDNTEHHRKLNLSNFPHHKHDGREDNVLS